MSSYSENSSVNVLIIVLCNQGVMSNAIQVLPHSLLCPRTPLSFPVFQYHNHISFSLSQYVTIYIPPAYLFLILFFSCKDLSLSLLHIMCFQQIQPNKPRIISVKGYLTTFILKPITKIQHVEWLNCEHNTIFMPYLYPSMDIPKVV